MADAAYFQDDSGAASRYLTVRNDGGSAFTYHLKGVSPTHFNYWRSGSFPGMLSAWLASCAWNFRVPSKLKRQPTAGQMPSV